MRASMSSIVARLAWTDTLTAAITFSDSSRTAPWSLHRADTAVGSRVDRH